MGNHKMRLAIRTALGGGSLVASIGAVQPKIAPAVRAIAAGLGASLISLAAMAADTNGPADTTGSAPTPELVEIVVTG
jgi:hypothetical protein